MCDIMDKLHEYVPAQQVIECFDVFGDGECIEMDEEIYHQVLLGGDQLTVPVHEAVQQFVRITLHMFAPEEIALKGYYLLLKTGMLSNVY